jgi:hypothetical protein
MLDRKEETDDTDSERVRLDPDRDAEREERKAEIVGAIGMLTEPRLGTGVDPSSLDSINTTSYWPTSLEAIEGL